MEPASARRRRGRRSNSRRACGCRSPQRPWPRVPRSRSEEHTSELQSLRHLVCRLLLEKKKNHERNYHARRPAIDTSWTGAKKRTPSHISTKQRDGQKDLAPPTTGTHKLAQTHYTTDAR